MEHPHHRHRIIKDWKDLPARLSETMRQKDEERLEPYAFLQQAGEDLPGELAHSEARLSLRIRISALACAVLFLLFAVLGRFGRGTLQDMLQRPAYGEEARETEVHLQLTYGEASREEDLVLQIPPRTVTRKEAETLFDACEIWLRRTVFGGQADPVGVTKDLALPLHSEDDLVEIAWNSSDPVRIAEDGKVDLIGSGKGSSVLLTASLCAGDYGRQVAFSLQLMESDADLEDSLQRESEALQLSLAETLTEERQELPAESPFGAAASWSLPAEGLPWEILGLFLFLAASFVFGRMDPLQRHLKKQKASFEREIPGMSLQMILLLDAGLTVDGAFSRLIRENKASDHPLYRALSSLEEESRATNLPFVNALYRYARQSGIRDLIRFASLALDCSGRGSELADKLDRERQQLWNDRLNQAKARAREAETKLCLPLMLLLLVLVVIAIAPALMEM